jgi:hypothetical protein
MGMAVVCLAVLAAACGGNSTPSSATPSSSAAKAPSAAKKRAATDDQMGAMVGAVGLGKSTLPVLVKFELKSRPKANEALPIDIAVTPQIAADSLVVQVMPSDGLNTSAVGPDLAVGPVDAGGVYRQSFSVTPGQTGILLLGLNVSLKHDEITESRVFSVPVFIVDEPRSK